MRLQGLIVKWIRITTFIVLKFLRHVISCDHMLSLRLLNMQFETLYILSRGFFRIIEFARGWWPALSTWGRKTIATLEVRSPGIHTLIYTKGVAASAHKADNAVSTCTIMTSPDQRSVQDAISKNAWSTILQQFTKHWRKNWKLAPSRPISSPNSLL